MLGGVLLSDQSDPPLRLVISTLMSNSQRADFAVANVRLAAIDLQHRELARLQKVRLLLDRLDVAMLSDVADAAEIGGPLGENLAVLRAFATSGRLELRAAGGRRWSPDFSVLYGLPPSPLAPAGAACLVGAIYFGAPPLQAGASLTCALPGRAAVQSAGARFERLWAEGHDVLPVISDLLRELLTPKLAAV